MSSSEDFGTYFSKFPSKTYRKRYSIINAGDFIQKIFYLKKGYVRLYSVSSEGKELTLIIYKPGNFFPLLTALQPNKAYPYYVETLTPAEVISVPLNLFIALFKDNPDLLMGIANEIMSRLDGALKRMEYMAFGNVYQKIASILMLVADRFGKPFSLDNSDSSTIIDLPLTHKDIGLLIAATRETVSMEIKRLEKKGIIGYKGRNIIIKNIKLLEKEALLFEEY